MTEDYRALAAAHAADIQRENLLAAALEAGLPRAAAEQLLSDDGYVISRGRIRVTLHVTWEEGEAGRGRRLCGYCRNMHARAYPEQPGTPCYSKGCGCWCMPTAEQSAAAAARLEAGGAA